MNHTTGAELIMSSPCIIGEGAVIERLRRIAIVVTSAVNQVESAGRPAGWEAG